MTDDAQKQYFIYLTVTTVVLGVIAVVKYICKKPPVTVVNLDETAALTHTGPQRNQAAPPAQPSYYTQLPQPQPQPQPQQDIMQPQPQYVVGQPLMQQQQQQQQQPFYYSSNPNSNTGYQTGVDQQYYQQQQQYQAFPSQPRTTMLPPPPSRPPLLRPPQLHPHTLPPATQTAGSEAKGKATEAATPGCGNCHLYVGVKFCPACGTRKETQ